VTVAVSVTACPAGVSLSDDVSVVAVELAGLTTWVSCDDALAPSVASPEYEARIEWLAAPVYETVHVATPEVTAWLAHPEITVPPSPNCTVPPAEEVRLVEVGAPLRNEIVRRPLPDSIPVAGVATIALEVM
jgi:hypothetical protein